MRMVDEPAAGLPANLEAVVRAALAEDIGDGDLTAALIGAGCTSHATVICRETAILCGGAWFDKVFELLDDRVRVCWHAPDGAAIGAGETVCELAGPARALVSGERTALNFLQTLSGTATVTRRFVTALGGSRTRLLDTRKTLPGLRSAQKYAVRCGGACNHRAGLYDGILIKENHIAAAGSIGAALREIRRQHPGRAVEIEVETLAQLDEAIGAGADRVLLDNFSVAAMRAAVTRAAQAVELEASGGFDFDTIGEVAATGVDFVSVGALTKHLRAIDFSMRFVHPA